MVDELISFLKLLEKQVREQREKLEQAERVLKLEKLRLRETARNWLITLQIIIICDLVK